MHIYSLTTQIYPKAGSGNGAVSDAIERALFEKANMDSYDSQCCTGLKCGPREICWAPPASSTAVAPWSLKSEKEKYSHF